MSHAKSSIRCREGSTAAGEFPDAQVPAICHDRGAVTNSST
jgi:hypothetical protein